MENAVDALKMAFAIFVFVIAISITFSNIALAQDTAKQLLYYADKTNYQEHLDDSDTIVTIKDIVPKLYKCINESIVIQIVDYDGNVIEDEEKKAEIGIDTNEDKETKIIEIIKILNKDTYKNKEFIEQFAEVPYSGKYKIDEDTGEKITITPGGTEVYIIYKLSS